jgi:deoxyribodipyrimidine photo-lyase
LSAYITYGNLSQKKVYQAYISRIAQLKTYQNQDLSEEKKKRLTYRLRSLRACLSRIHRRCHFIQKLESRPEIEYENQNSGFNNIRQIIDQDIINLWYN